MKISKYLTEKIKNISLRPKKIPTIYFFVTEICEKKTMKF